MIQRPRGLLRCGWFVLWIHLLLASAKGGLIYRDKLPQKEPETSVPTLSKVDEHQEIDKESLFYETCTLRDVENKCAQNVTMAHPNQDGTVMRAPGVSVWIQAHCGSGETDKDSTLQEKIDSTTLEEQNKERAKCVLSYIGDDFGEDQATEFFACVCDECPRACLKKGNLRNQQNLIAKETSS